MNCSMLDPPSRLGEMNAKWCDALIGPALLGGCERLASKPASLEEISKVVDALRAAGCTGLKELDVEADEYEVGGVLCSDGKSYDVKLDKSFNVISKRADWL
jgi:hypothetical protein